MSQILNRLERLIRSNLQSSSGWDSVGYDSINDADMRDAWEELNRFLDEDDLSDHAEPTENKRPPEALRKDYETLGVPFGAPFDTVRKAYREKLRINHPDLHAGDPENQQRATEFTQRLILSFRKIRLFHENGTV